MSDQYCCPKTIMPLEFSLFTINRKFKTCIVSIFASVPINLWVYLDPVYSSGRSDPMYIKSDFVDSYNFLFITVRNNFYIFLQRKPFTPSYFAVKNRECKCLSTHCDICIIAYVTLLRNACPAFPLCINSISLIPVKKLTHKVIAQVHILSFLNLRYLIYTYQASVFFLHYLFL